MAKHLTDKQKKKIIADYAECGNYSEVARKHHISFDTVKRVVTRDPETLKKTEQKKEQNTLDILSYMESKKNTVCEFIDKYLDAMMNDEKIAAATVNQLSTALGTVIDKFTANIQKQPDVTLFATIAQASGGFKHE